MTDPVRLQTETVVDGLVFPECPRWHDGALWFSDQHGGYVARLDPATNQVEKVLELDDQPSGLGWLPDGRLLVVAMLDRTVLRARGRRPGRARGPLDARRPGTATTWSSTPRVAPTSATSASTSTAARRSEPAKLVLRRPDGSVARRRREDSTSRTARVITPDGGTLIVGESVGDAPHGVRHRAPTATLANRPRSGRSSSATSPDGCCLDAEGAIWFAIAGGAGLLRVLEGGEVTHRCRHPGPSRSPSGSAATTAARSTPAPRRHSSRTTPARCGKAASSPYE